MAGFDRATLVLRALLVRVVATTQVWPSNVTADHPPWVNRW